MKVTLEILVEIILRNRVENNSENIVKINERRFSSLLPASGGQTSLVNAAWSKGSPKAMLQLHKHF